MNLVLTCPFWLESIAKKEIELLWLPILNSQDRQITTSFSDEALIKLNLWSRVGNKVYIELAKKDKIDSFDKLFELVKSINWNYFLNENNPIIVNANSKNSKLFSLPDIQKISKKAIIESLWWWLIKEDNTLNWLFIEIVLIGDTCQVLIDSSWTPLHKRWYRKVWVEAPLRENLAAWLVLLSNWKFRENFYDLFCWSWTIVIEAAMIARNIAPWLNRKFAFQDWKFIDLSILKKEKENAKNKIFSKNYNIFASDLDEEALNIAKNNAINAWVNDTIKFIKKDFIDYQKENLSWTLVSNPPYGIRLDNYNLEILYKDLANFLNSQKDLKSSIITNYQLWNLLKFDYKKRKLYNWQEMCYMYKKVEKSKRLKV